MNQADLDVVILDTVETIKNLLRVKGGEYAGSVDRLANFKRGAELTGAHPLQVLFIYMSKHYDAVMTYVKDQAVGQVRERSEPIEGRLDDLINYCILAKALIKETRQNEESIARNRISSQEFASAVSKNPDGYWPVADAKPD